ncbi:GOLPH3/VPS74 family protein [Sanguibacter gelidistatuariae]|uniref:GOLPH3/VPS74 family protein n=1 Tax=Sanguibacter gelidistatuariae TaxID=1814289 RepID=UPI001FE1E921
MTASGRIDVARPTDPAETGHIVVRDSRPVGDPLLDRGLAVLLKETPSLPAVALWRVGRGLREQVYARLADGGFVRPTVHRRWGLFPSQRWLVTDSGHKDLVRAGLRDVLTVKRAPSDHELSLLVLLNAVSAVGQALSEPGLKDSSPQVRALDRRADALLAAPPVERSVQPPLEAVRGVMAEVIKGASETSA